MHYEPVSQKFLLTAEEASDYFHIGKSRLREMAKRDTEGYFTLKKGTHTLFKRKRFEEYILDTYSI